MTRRPGAPRRRALSPSRAQVLELVRRNRGVRLSAIARFTGLHENTVRGHLEALLEDGLVARSRSTRAERGRPPWLWTAARPDDAGYAGLAAALARSMKDVPGAGSIAVEAGRAWAAELVAEGAGTPVAEGAGEPDDEGDVAGSGKDPAGAPSGEATPSGASSAADPPEGATRAGGSSAVDPSGHATPKAAGTRGTAVEAVVDLMRRLCYDPQQQDGSGHVTLHSCPLLAAASDTPEIVCAVHHGLVRGALDARGAGYLPTELEPFASPGTCVLRIGGDDA